MKKTIDICAFCQVWSVNPVIFFFSLFFDKTRSGNNIGRKIVCPLPNNVGELKNLYSAERQKKRERKKNAAEPKTDLKASKWKSDQGEATTKYADYLDTHK